MADVVKVNDEIYTITDLFTEQECEAWIAQSESLGYELATINSQQGPQHLPNIRNNARVILDDRSLAEQLWQRVENDVPNVFRGWKTVGLNERLRFYRYDVGQKFSWHADGCVRLDNGQQSMVTFMVYLNQNFLGGETLFRGGIRIQPRTGLVLMFTHWQKHMGNEVRDGRKYVLRSDVMYQRTKN